jgi:hypothetical protein
MLTKFSQKIEKELTVLIQHSTKFLFWKYKLKAAKICYMIMSVLI